MTAADLSPDARLTGLILFHLGTHSTGTPREDPFIAQPLHRQVALASKASVARLPERLLSHPKAGAVASVGLIDRAWLFSFPWCGFDHRAAYWSVLTSVLAGRPIGMAVGAFCPPSSLNWPRC